MSQVEVVLRRYVLVGPYEGKTINLGSKTNPIQFKEGVHTFRGPSDHAANLGVFLARCYNAHPEGPALDAARAAHRKLMEASRGSRTSVRPGPEIQVRQEVGADADGGAGDNAETDGAGRSSTAEGGQGTAAQVGSEPSVNEPSAAVKKAVLSLDPANDDHWTQMGLPALAAVAELAGSSGIKRADVEAAAPGFNREVAAAAK